MPLSLGDRDPYLTARIEEAYTHAKSRDDLVKAFGPVALGNLVNEGIVTARDKAFAPDTLREISNPTTRRLFSERLIGSAVLYDRIGLHAPSPADLRDSGVSFTLLGDLFERMNEARLKPQLILAPSIEPELWEDLFKELQTDTTIPNNPLPRRSDEPAINITDIVKSHWSEITEIPEVAPIVSTVNRLGCQIAWTVRIVSGTDASNHVNVARCDRLDQDHPSINEYLALQAGLIQSGDKPVDSNSITWLNGSMLNGCAAPNGFWSALYGRVHLGYDYCDINYPGLGVRMTGNGQSV